MNNLRSPVSFAPAVVVLAACGGTSPAEPAPQDGGAAPQSCMVAFSADVTAGKDKGTSVAGVMQYSLAADGAIAGGKMTTWDGAAIGVSGSMKGTAIDLAIDAGKGLVLHGTGASDGMPRYCVGEMKGTLTGPDGDAGDWAGGTGAVVVAQDGTSYVSDPAAHVIRSLPFGGTTYSIYAGALNTPGSADGARKMTARFNKPDALAIDANQQYLFVADLNNQAIRRIEFATNNVTTPVKLAQAQAAATASGASISAWKPYGLGYQYQQGLYVSDNVNHCIWRADPGVTSLTLFAGKPLVSGNVDGARLSARFQSPDRLSANPAGGNFFATTYTINIAQPSTCQIRLIDSSSGNVTHVAGSCT